MAEENNNITFFAETNYRNKRSRFGMKRIDRRKHMYIIGKTGMGKTTLLENMAIQDIQNGEGVAIVDPHGEFAEKMLAFVPESRKKDVVYFNPADMAFPVAFNTMENVSVEQRHLVASGLLSVFKKIWADLWSARMEYLLANAILALLETPNATLLGINRMFADKTYRKGIVAQLTDPVVRAFWEKEYASYQDKFASEASAAIQNKVGQFTSNPLIRNIIGQAHSSVDMRRIMDEQKIFIMNLSKGKVGEENSRLLGAMLVTKLYLTAMSRVDVPESERKDFYLYVDEFQNFATDSFAGILSEARKYRLNLILAHQYVAQMEEKVQDAVFGNVGTTVAFRVGAQDAEILEKEFSPEFMVQDLVNLSFAQIYLKLMIDGVASRPFSATTLPPMALPEQSFADEIIELSRRSYGSSQAEIEKTIMEFHGLSATGAALPGTAVAEEKPERREKPVREMFDAHCVVDNEAIKVPFKPDNRRSVYCEKHLEMFKAGTLPQPVINNVQPTIDNRQQTPSVRKFEARERMVPQNRFDRRPRSEQSNHRESPRRENRFEPRRNEPRRIETHGQYAPRPVMRSSESIVRIDSNAPRMSLGALKPRPTPDQARELKIADAQNAEKNIGAKKQVDALALREILEKSLEGVKKNEQASDKKENSEQKNSGILKPGDTIRFD